jgi:glycosyltransferase involved in cell wall biosynthesis
MSKFTGRLAFQQRVIPSYRAPFFDLLAQSCEGRLALLAGQPLPVESIRFTSNFAFARYTPAKNLQFGDPCSSAYLCWQRGVMDWLEEIQPDALIVEANPRYLSTRLAVRWMHRRNRIVLGWGLGAPRAENQSIINTVESVFRTAFLRSLDGVLAYSRRGANEYRALGLKNVFVAHNAVSPRPDKDPPTKPAKLDKGLTVLFVGRLQNRKRVDILLQACADLPVAMQPRLLIVGDGPAKNEFKVVANRIYPHAEFLGAQHGEALTPYFDAADLFALPGTGGLAIQQAMGKALPVIVAQGDGTQDDLVRPGNGWQVPSGDQAAFSQTLEKALSDIPRLRRMGAESYRIVTEEINLELMVEAFINALNQYEIM